MGARTIIVIAAVILGFTAAAQDENNVHFHSVRLNVTNPAATLDFYSKILGAVKVKYADTTDALFTERSFIILNEVDDAPPWQPHTAISHIGWSTTDGQASSDWLEKHNVTFETPLTQLGNNFGMYFYGPDKELVELWTGSRTHRFEHIHLWATDVEETIAWFREHLGVMGRAGAKPETEDYDNLMSIWMGTMLLDNINIVVFGRPDFDSRWWPGGSYSKEDGPQNGFKPTQGTTINHIAFSFRDIDPIFEKLKAAGAEIVEPIADRPEVGHRSFYTLAPDNLLVEIVEAKPIPESSWE